MVGEEDVSALEITANGPDEPVFSIETEFPLIGFPPAAAAFNLG